ncbi:VTT domain-containing protein [Propionicicella superfundia]|uniref:VTT domain-containing protein n=1 Tax=Propionicicella superfundia TaxID=348582 RepID=UPI0004076C75|nr:VTT domain-containing protein [Propionicicella superfundia]
MDVTSLLVAAGPFALALIAVIVFVENGLLFPFLPGDSLVFAAALLATHLDVPWPSIAGVAAAAAVLGGEVGFAIGRRRGRGLFRPDARIFRQRYLDEADAFFARHGTAAIVMARFVPIVRTFLAPAAGISSIGRLTFSLWNAIGGCLWAGGLAVAGYYLGDIPWVARNVELLTVGIVLVSVVPVVLTALLRRLRARRAGPGAA